MKHYKVKYYIQGEIAVPGNSPKEAKESFMNLKNETLLHNCEGILVVKPKEIKGDTIAKK